MSIAVTSQTLGGFHVGGIKQESIDEVNRLLQHNHEAFHVIYNTAAGMHNHHVHYLLTDLSLGATPAQLRRRRELWWGSGEVRKLRCMACVLRTPSCAKGCSRDHAGVSVREDSSS